MNRVVELVEINQIIQNQEVQQIQQGGLEVVYDLEQEVKMMTKLDLKVQKN